MRACWLAGIVLIGSACRGGPCGSFEAWQTAVDADGRDSTGRFVRGCTQDSSGVWEANDVIRLRLSPRPVSTEQTDAWRLSLSMDDGAVREGARLEAGAMLWGSAGRSEAAAGLALTRGHVDILDVGGMGDPCLAGAELPLKVRYEVGFGAERDGGPGASASGTDRFHVAVGEWACR